MTPNINLKNAMVKQYDENSYMVVEYIKNQFDTDYYILNLFSNAHVNIASSEKESSMCLCYMGKSNGFIVLVKMDYVCNKSSIIVEFYEIKNEKILKNKVHIIDSDFTLNDTMLKVNKSDQHNFIIMWSDLFNYDYLQIANVSHESYKVCNIIKHEMIDENSFKELYMTSETFIGMMCVIGNNNDNISMIFKNVMTETQYAGGTTSLCLKHNNEKNTTFDTKIIESITNGDKQHILAEINIISRLDILHISNSKIYMLFEIIQNHKLPILLDAITDSFDFYPSIIYINNIPHIFSTFNKCFFT